MIKVQAHRGACAYAPENTLPSFQLAHDMHADGIECDIHLSSDGVFVVCHDETIDRTSTGHGRIPDMTYAEISSYDFGVKHDRGHMGVTAPTLEQMLDIVRDMPIINIEIKEFAGDETAALHKFYAVLERYGVVPQVIVSSFNGPILKRLKELHPDLFTAFLYQLCEDAPADALARLDGFRQKLTDAGFMTPAREAFFTPVRGAVEYAHSIHCGAIHPALDYLTQATVDQAHALGMDVNCWTPNTRAEIEHAVALGCNGIITNHPDWVLLALGR